MKHLLILGLIALFLAACTTPIAYNGGETPPTQHPTESDLQGEWKLISGENNGPFEADATIHFRNGSIGGNAPCNTYSSETTIEEGTIRIEGIMQTEAACMDNERMESENKYFDTLRNANSIELEGETLILSSNQGELRFTRTPTDEEAFQAEYANGTLSYTARIMIPTPCHRANTQEHIIESDPPRVEVSVTFSEPSSDLRCVQMIDEREISGSIEIGQEPSSVRIDTPFETHEIELS